MLVPMQRVHFSAGKALCRFCGEMVATNRLSTHIAKEHPRPGQIETSPKLVPKRPKRPLPAKRPSR